jgi:hypothetical protein
MTIFIVFTAKIDVKDSQKLTKTMQNDRFLATIFIVFTAQNVGGKFERTDFYRLENQEISPQFSFQPKERRWIGFKV